MVLSFSGCGRSDHKAATFIPTAIVQTVRPAGVSTDEWSGVVRARQTAQLAFSVAGRVERIAAEVGDRIERGEVLIELDQEPFRLQLQQAEAEARAAVPALAEATRRRDSEERLWSANATSRADHDAALSAFAAAASRAEAADAALGLARRALRESRLVAPAAGRVAQRLVQASAVVAPGTPVLEFDPESVAEVVLTVPGPRIAELAIDQPVDVRYRLTEATPSVATGRITHIGQRSLAGGVHEVLVRLPDTAAAFPGEAVVVRLPVTRSSTAVRIPVTALQPTKPGSAAVLVLDAASGAVRRRDVRFTAPQGDTALVSEGLRDGETVVVAGLSFLRDGQQVRAIRRD